MKKLLTILILFIATNAFAVLSSPPVIKGGDVQTQQYFKQLYDNHNKLEITTTNPNSTRQGRLGDIIIYNNAGTYYIYVCESSPSGTNWTNMGGGGGGGITTTRGTFTNGDLVAGVLTITHSKALSAPYPLLIMIFDNNNRYILPDNITGSANSVKIDLTSYGVLVGTWGYEYV